MATKEMRLVLTVDDFESATRYFRDVLGMKQVADWQNDGGHAVLLDAGRATVEIFDEAQARAIDLVEVGRRVAGPVRVAFEVADSASTAAELAEVAGTILAGP
ncbi:MAG TPA: VOC family protein, partial [Patescibacteria group bacterium]|nr:VOC family protein [Patescibacteria group bacterium]